MKTLITSIAFLLAFANNANAETTLVRGIDTQFLNAVSANAQQFETSLLTKANNERKSAPIDDVSILNPETVITVKYERPIEEIIAENNKIIETKITDEGYLFFVETPIEKIIESDNQIIDSNISTAAQPLYLERTIEAIIAEDNAITEGTIPTETGVLNFKTINKNATIVEN